MKSLIETFAYDQSNAANSDLVEMRYQASIQEGFQEAFSSMFPAPRQQHLDAMALSDDELRNIQAPVLLIHGREDKVIPLAETSWKISQLIPKCSTSCISTLRTLGTNRKNRAILFIKCLNS